MNSASKMFNLYCIFGFFSSFAIASAYQILPEPLIPYDRHNSACYGPGTHEQLRLSCPNNESVIAVHEVRVGSKLAESRCPTSVSKVTDDTGSYLVDSSNTSILLNETACCFPDEDNDCTLLYNYVNSGIDYKYHIISSGYSESKTSMEVSWQTTNCDNSSTYQTGTNFMYFDYSCIPRTRIGNICSNRSFKFTDEAFYLYNGNYPDNVPSTTDFCTCQIQTNGTTIEFYSIDMRLEKYNNECKQALNVTDSNGTTAWDCDSAQIFNVTKLVMGQTVTLAFENDLPIDGGFVWIGFHGNRNDTLEIECSYEKKVLSTTPVVFTATITPSDTQSASDITPNLPGIHSVTSLSISTTAFSPAVTNSASDITPNLPEIHSFTSFSMNSTDSTSNTPPTAIISSTIVTTFEHESTNVNISVTKSLSTSTSISDQPHLEIISTATNTSLFSQPHLEIISTAANISFFSSATSLSATESILSTTHTSSKIFTTPHLMTTPMINATDTTTASEQTPQMSSLISTTLSPTRQKYTSVIPQTAFPVTRTTIVQEKIVVVKDTKLIVIVLVMCGVLLLLVITLIIVIVRLLKKHGKPQVKPDDNMEDNIEVKDGDLNRQSRVETADETKDKNTYLVNKIDNKDAKDSQQSGFVLPGGVVGQSENVEADEDVDKTDDRKVNIAHDNKQLRENRASKVSLPDIAKETKYVSNIGDMLGAALGETDQDDENEKDTLEETEHIPGHTHSGKRHHTRKWRKKKHTRHLKKKEHNL
ncbi:uncharacterized protein LOC132745110 isoform X2 [Ruditapes philippinarum]|uniref:uncharacterized protein LOC132745110 isoform X2 n=1 Tax=Ruditapes philippinarum TaxID=129788 RepID=UPI00295A9C2F|nr:uncharacterized protein LOC132745110 isoform X2 [Ruditapes philippinarum]